MLCPWCGSPVMIHGSRWECGWCGDFGEWKRTPAQITATLSFVYHVDLAETWTDIKKALGQLAPKETMLSQLLGKVLLHSISGGIQHAGTMPDENKAEELQAFLNNTPDLMLGKSTDKIMQDARQGVLFCEEAALSETDCGTFWTKLIAMRPVEEYYNGTEPGGLYDLLSGLSAAYAYFSGKNDDAGNEADSYQNVLEEAYHIHWQDSVLLHPDIERAKRLLSEGTFPANEDICREILLIEYPEEVPHETAEIFDDLSWESILDVVFARNTAKGVKMWRSLLDAAGTSLKDDPDTAKKLLPDWDWLDSRKQDQVLPLLLALKDESFLSQLFESAFIGRLQLTILSACHDCGQEELGQHCLEIALKNPYLEENWEKRFRRVFTAAPSSEESKPHSYTARTPSEDSIPDDGTVFHYCSIQVQGIRRPYAYLTGGLPLKVGDWVELPVGKENRLRQGQVKAVMDCTRMVAPWPPEQTKTVIRVIDAPVSIQPMESDVPKKERHIEQPEKPVKTSPVLMPETETVQPRTEPQSLGSAVFEKRDEKPTTQKKPFLFGKLIAAVLTVAVIVGIALAGSNHKKRQAAAYEDALQALTQGDYSSAEEGFSSLPNYRDAASLATYCKYAGIYNGKTEYVGGQDELADINLQYDTDWQKDVDTLESRVKSYKTEKDAAEEAERKRIAAENAAKQEQSLKEQYSGKLPVDGMPVSCLKYTSIGSPTKTEKCQFYDNMDVHRRYKILHWYNSEGQIVAYCHSHQPKDETAEIIYAFTYHETPIGRPNSAPEWTPPSTSDNGNSGSVRDDYDNPEDFWEDNQDWFDDEDDAWDYWYDD